MNAIYPNWQAPKNIKALTTVRSGGVSLPPFDSFNLGDHVCDDTKAVQKNRSLIEDKLD